MRKKKTKWNDPSATLWMPASPIAVSGKSAVSFDEATAKQVDRAASIFAKAGASRILLPRRKAKGEQLFHRAAVLRSLARTMKDKGLKHAGELTLEDFRSAQTSGYRFDYIELLADAAQEKAAA